ncbi:MAG: cystathionine gamma-synthase [Deltaproteobacteria bacterium]|nr:cystathionine gamma-synthase [Deltaproteobacteria bacterium]
MDFSTKAIHAGQKADSATGATITPIYQTTTYTQEALGKHKGYEYSRTQNPTRTALETCLASLENGKYGLTFSSGCAATATVLAMLKPGDHVLASDEVYGGTWRLLAETAKYQGLHVTFVNARNAESFVKCVGAETKLIWFETPTNPLLSIIDIKAITEAARKKKVATVLDNTFATPYFQRGLDLGVDIILHSTTKYIGGHSDVVGGAIVTSSGELYERLKFLQNAIGAVPSPFDCWLTLRGLKTLAVRMEKHAENAEEIAKWLAKHKKVERVFYPGLKEHKGHDIAKTQMSGFSGMVSFEAKGGFEAAKKVAESLKVFSLAESLGGVESLVCYPATMTHASVPKEDRLRIGITDGLIRLSVGIEDVADLIEDLGQAL